VELSKNKGRSQKYFEHKKDNKPHISEEERQKVREFKQRIKAGKVQAKLSNGETVTVVWRGTRGYKQKKEFMIKYYNSGEELIETNDYQLINEIFEK
jgi:hypothetical protein